MNVGGYHQQWWVALSAEAAAAIIPVIVNICAQLALDGSMELCPSKQSRVDILIPKLPL